LDEAVDRCHGKLSIGPGHVAPGYAIAYLELGGAAGGFAESYDDPCGFLAESVGELGGIAALAEVDVDEVDARGFDADESLAGTGRRCGEIAEGESIGSTGDENLNSLHGCWMRSCGLRFCENAGTPA
jgi:hypothetical protein